jgi:hypothetical protein
VSLNDVNNALLIAVGVLGLGSFIVFSTVEWWKWWSGRATWALWFGVIFASASFSLQEILGFEKGAVETVTLAVLCLIMLFNFCVHVYKKWIWKPEHDAKHDKRHPAREVY